LEWTARRNFRNCFRKLSTITSRPTQLWFTPISPASTPEIINDTEVAMQVHSDAAVQNKILVLVESLLAQHAQSGGIKPDTRLADAGLTSMEMVNLMLGVEAAFDMTLPQADITPENFTSVETIERLVLRRLPRQAA
jgi:acyl carrier protein